MTVDPDERADTVKAAIANYIAGEFGMIRLSAILVMCGLNAKEIEEVIAENRDVAYKAFVDRNKHRPRI